MVATPAAAVVDLPMEFSVDNRPLGLEAALDDSVTEVAYRVDANVVFENKL